MGEGERKRRSGWMRREGLDGEKERREEDGVVVKRVKGGVDEERRK